MQTWADFNGISIQGVRVGPLPGHEERGSTVIATRSLSGTEQAPLIKVPHDLVLSLTAVQQHAKVDQDFRQVLEALDDFGRT
ncbi:hypothetical protein LTR66_003445 [Elasticomyces elasticus]|nr:hypothetical protein LTR66_003445 [Elasticomyces elasticus]